MLASTWMDMVLGVDIHFEMVPMPGPVPTPIPNPFIGMVLDPAGLATGLAIGAAMSLAFGGPVTGPVLINGMPATNVGTNAKGMGHILIPPGTMWAPMPKFPKLSFKSPPTFPGPPIKPEDDAIAIQGSQTVNIMGASGVRMGEMFMSCGEPLRLPSSNVIAIPKGPPVMVGGPPAVSLLTALTSTIKTKWVAGYLYSALSNMSPGRLRTILEKGVCILTGHPVDVATGRVLTYHIDWELPGPLPLKFERNYSSAVAGRPGPLGYGWAHSLDQALWSERGKIVYLAGDGREIEFDTFDFPKHQLPPATDLFEPISRLTLRLDGKGGATVTTHDGIRHGFVPVSGATGERRDWLRLKHMTGRTGHSIDVEYDRRGNIEWVRDSGGRQVSFEHDTQGRLTVVKLPHPTDHGWLPHTRFLYDSNGDLVQVTDPLGHSWKFVYKNHLLVQETNRNGLSFYFAYDGHNQDAFCVRTWGDGGLYDHVLDYDKKGKVTCVTNSLGHTTSYKMNAIGCVLSTTDPLGHTTTSEYDERSLRKTKQVDSTGRVTEWAYDERGNCTKAVQPGGVELFFFYDGDNRLVKAVDGASGNWKWTYNSMGQLVAKQNPVGQVHHFDWQSEEALPSDPSPPALRARPRRRLVGFIDPGGNRTTLQYDSHNNLSALNLPDGSVMGWRHDQLGRCIEVIDAMGQKKHREFDALGRLARLGEPDGNVRVLQYDAEGNLTMTRDRLHDVRLTYQGMGRLASRSEHGISVNFTYDHEEQLTGIRNEAGNIYRFVVDPAGLVAEEHGFDGMLHKYVRDEAGRVLKVERPSNRATEYQYDEGGRVVLLQHTDGETEKFAYRKDGQMIGATNSAITVALERDTLGRILADIQGEDRVTSTYGPLGLRVKVATSLGHTLDIERNSMGDVLALRAGGESLPSRTQGGELIGKDFWEAHWSRNQLGQEIERHLPGGVRSRWQRDSMGRPVMHEIWSGQSQVRSRAYTWEPGGRLKMIIDAMNGPVSYQYDDLGNLAGAVYSESPADLRMPDAVGNLFRRADRKDRQHDPAGKVIRATAPEGVTNFEYDSDGNLTRKAMPDGREWRYEWTVSGRLSKVTRPDGCAVVFSYDALGRRIFKRHAGQTTRWLWDGNVPIHEWLEPEAPSTISVEVATSERRDAVGWETTETLRKQVLSEQPAQGPPPAGTRASPITWVFEPETFAPVAKLSASGNYTILTDHLGAPSIMLDTSGRQTWSADLDVYGGVRNLQGERSACPFRWAGQYEDDETGLYYNRFRYYDPTAGTYISQDPIGLLGGMRLYGYVTDPNTWLDPFGLGCKQDVTRDEEGRITSVQAQVTPADLGTGTGTNASSRAAARGMGQATDDAGHSIGRQLGGSGGVNSVFPQDPHINRGQFAQFENGVADHVRATGQPVDISQTFNYGNGGTRPTSINYVVTQNGSTVAQQTFAN